MNLLGVTFVVSMMTANANTNPVTEQQFERQILSSLYDYTDGESWTNNDGWKDPFVHCCDWHGIQCVSSDSTTRTRGRNLQNPAADESRAVESIDLAENNLRGRIPISLLLLFPKIRSIRLNGNNVDFEKGEQREIQILDKVLEVSVSLHSTISYFDVSHTSVKDVNLLFTTGSGDALIETPNLRTFYASQSQIRGAFPEFLMEVKTMEKLALDHNSLTGNLPEQLGKLSHLKYLSLAGNMLTGTIPNTVNALKKLRYFLLESNRLTGTIPLGLTSAEYTPLLEQLDISNQREESTPPGSSVGLSGTIPAFATQKRLRRVDLSVNSFTGTIPSNLLSETDVAQVDFVIFSSNLITGSVPLSVLSRLPSDGLLMDDNKITGLKNCPISEYNCAAILCPPFSYEPRSGRQEEDNRPCLDCPQNLNYWGQTVCQLDQSDLISAPTPPPHRPELTPETDAPPNTDQLTTAPTEVQSTEITSSSVEEKSILSAVYVATGGEGWITNDGWDERKDNISFCEWHGVVCVSEDVQSVKFLNLGGNHLQGTLPEIIYQLPNLKLLDLSKNDGLTGSFRNISKAKSLEALDLSQTTINDVDGLLGAAPTIQELHITDVAGFEGQSFPTSLFQLTNLRQLSMDYNGAVGSLPSDLDKLSRLVIFSASNNELTGSIPSSIVELRDLQVLRLSTNHLSGTLPQGIESMNSLTLIDLSNQWSNGLDDDFSEKETSGIGGPLPSFSNLSQLSRLDLGVNSFTGKIPENFLASVDPDLFDYVDLGVNFFSGTVPSGVARLPKLYLQDNLLTGIAPEVCKNLPSTLEKLGCDAILCPPGFSNSLGRKSSNDNPCVPCTVSDGAKYYGSTDCSDDFSDSFPIDQPTIDKPTIDKPTIDKPTNGPILDESERNALEVVFNKCNGPGWDSKINWLNESTSICLWGGIRCDVDGKISEIELHSNSLVGTFPSSVVFNGIPTLTKLVLDGNRVEFNFEGMDKASNLNYLDLTKVKLTSFAGVSNASNLENLFLSSSNLKGTFPSEILELSNLIRLSLPLNDLSGSIPNEISKLSNLIDLALHDNEFIGTIPRTLGQMTDLNFLTLQSNNFAGDIPTELNLLENLGYFSLKGQRGNSGKGLSGPLPSFATLTNLKKMDLSRNSLIGTIPANFLDLVPTQLLLHVGLAGNLLSGELPRILSKFSAKQYDFSDNRISDGEALCSASTSGSVTLYGCDAVLCPIGKWNKHGRQVDDKGKCRDCAESVFLGAVKCDESDGKNPPSPSPTVNSQLTNVEILTMVFDECRGNSWHRKDNWKQSGMSVCEWYGIHCDQEGNIERVILSTNNMNGDIPTEIFHLPHLKILNLDSNNVDFNFSGIESASNLQMLDISNTSTHSLEGIGGATQLRELHMKEVGFAGSLPPEIFDLTKLEQMDFDFNSFSGPLGHNIGKLSNLKQLSGEGNKFTGVIPDELRKLTNLVSLRLGKNSFQGNVPAEALDQMTSLEYIDLSRQTEHGGPGLSGELPALTNLHILKNLRLKDNAFSGTIPYNFLENVDQDEFRYAGLSSNSLTGTIPSLLARLGDTIRLQNNMIDDFPSAFCDVGRGAAYSQFQCDAFLCKPGTFNPHGRQESNETSCSPCLTSSYYGSTSCIETSAQTLVVDATPVVDEKTILIKLYHACRGEAWDESENWLDDSQSICEWQGVRCAEGNAVETVEAIELGANNLKGTPPTELYTLPNLTILSLYSNPLDSFDFEGIQHANKMTELLLDSTRIASIAGIEKAPKLEILNLRFNGIKGSFPSELTKISTLHTLTMAYNDLTGTLPTSIEEMTNLRALLLSHNKLSGNLHHANFPQSIRRLDLSDNMLTGSVPESFLTMVPFAADLEVDLSSNILTGSIPTDLIRFQHLNLYLKDNQISKLDNQLCGMPEWNEGDVGKYGCNGLLCPQGHFSTNGRHSSSGECHQCANGRALHFGASTCMGVSASASLDGISLLMLLGILSFFFR